MNKVRRRFLQMFGLGVVGSHSSASSGFQASSNSLYFGQELTLAKEAYEQIKDTIAQMGNPSFVFVHNEGPSTDNLEGREILKVVWNSSISGVWRHTQEIDFGRELGPDWNDHYRMMWRVADILSEAIGCKIGWSYSANYDGTPKGRQNFKSTDPVSYPTV